MTPLAAFVQVLPNADAHPIERRTAERRPCRLEAVSHDADAPDSLCWGAMIRDISAGGIGLTLCYPFKPGTYLAIDVQSPEAPGPLLGRVVHVADQADGTWFIGCEFIRQLQKQ
jgi:hypothetical protein